MNRQEVFNTVREHLIDQGKPCLDDFGNCLYRDGRGMERAIGCLISDDAYSVDIKLIGIV